ncbi:tetratricopeptide repeat protein [Limnoglobus roseus]|uniref:Tetratricopeptide repeat protein n=1 Tax=Limnoglobus roseus TaxID=2598579 RepID=A0A5C1ABQ4_9BACT|nr:serine/threonine-protein kinase [Limnoglobus roseus]QEL15456.1 tetratricopeptide repeat protein [Limnoglobus roseus]
MTLPAHPDLGSDLLDAFEVQLRLDPTADLADFLLPPDHPHHLAELTELARLDMEYARGRGAPRPPEHYFAAFPALRENAIARAGLAFEDYRLRKCGGESVGPADYARRYGVDVTGWPVDSNADREPRDPFPGDSAVTPLPAARIEQLRTSVLNPGSSPRPPVENLPTVDGRKPGSLPPASGRAVGSPPSALPDLHTRFLGFDLIEELGRGAFGRVYLARQGDLAGRLVALKVARGLFAESQTLAQLQHTNIVPIYSAHEADGVQAVCMPYFGRCTLAHVLAEIRARGDLPTTGEELVDTVRLGQTVTRSDPRNGTHRPLAAPEIQVSPAGPEAGADGRPADSMWARLAALSYPDAVVWVVAHLAAGLAHAHDRGILHRDLKPANVLLTDDGVPMLLDFNIAEDTKVRGPLRRVVGGTLPYMAPEQLEAYARDEGGTDGRADVYALGIILFEMLTGSRPFADVLGETDTVVREMIEARRGGSPRVSAHNPMVSPAVASVVAKCLAADPADRYASARDLHEDLTRHLADLPLKHAPDDSARERFGKWRRRHPRLASATSVGVLALIVLAATAGGAFVVRERSRAFEARIALADSARDRTALQALLDDRNQTRESLDRGIELCRASLARYEISTDAENVPADWDRSRLIRYLPAEDRSNLRDEFGEVFYLMAKAAGRRAELTTDDGERAARLADAGRWNGLAAGYGADRIPRAVRAQRADLERLAGRPGEADRAAAEADRTPTASARDHYLLGYWHHHQGRHRQAAPELAAATAADPTNFSSWFVRGMNHLALEQNDLAAMCFTACVSHRPDFAPVWVNRGIALARLRKLDLALADYAEANRLVPDSADVQILRGGVLQARGKVRDAADAFTAALKCPDCPTRVYFYRAQCLRPTDPTAAAADEAEALKREPTDELSWTARAEAKLEAKDLRHLDPTARHDAIGIPGWWSGGRHSVRGRRVLARLDPRGGFGQGGVRHLPRRCSGGSDTRPSGPVPGCRADRW